MIYKYKSSEFEKLRNILFIFVENYINDQSLSQSKRSFIAVFYRILDKNNLSTLHALDDMNLSFNDWANNDISISIISRQNIMLLDIYNDKDLKNFDFDAVLNAMFLVIYADFYEASLVCEDPFLRPTLQNTVNSLNENLSYLAENNFKTLTDLWFITPQKVFTKRLNMHLDPQVLKTVKDLQDHSDLMTKKINESKSLKKHIGEIQKSLEEQKTEYNFVGLSKGFTSLKDNKVAELKSEKSVYNWLMVIIILLIIAKSAWSAYYLSNNDFNSPIFIIITVSTVLFLFILLYFFRISLVNVKSIKSQILQIDLRLTLCQFIHNYDSNTKDLREGMKESFGKFESVIFSPLVATEDQMPSTFDGLEQLTGMIGLFNKKSD